MKPLEKHFRATFSQTLKHLKEAYLSEELRAECPQLHLLATWFYNNPDKGWMFVPQEFSSLYDDIWLFVSFLAELRFHMVKLYEFSMPVFAGHPRISFHRESELSHDTLANYISQETVRAYEVFDQLNRQLEYQSDPAPDFVRKRRLSCDNVTFCKNAKEFIARAEKYFWIREQNIFIEQVARDLKDSPGEDGLDFELSHIANVGNGFDKAKAVKWRKRYAKRILAKQELLRTNQITKRL
jgi:hypothetical protein